MATKPTEPLNFEPSGSAVVEIPSGKQAVGFLAGERPPAQYFNWILRATSRLYNYVLDGALSGNHTIAGTLGVTGNVAAPDFKHGPRTLELLPSAFAADPAQASIAINNGTGQRIDFVTSSATPFSIAQAAVGIPVPIGSRIINVRVWLNKNGHALEFAASLKSRSSSTNAQVFLATVNDSTSTTDRKSVDAAPVAPGYVLPDGHSLELHVQQTFTGLGQPTVHVYGASVTYDRP